MKNSSCAVRHAAVVLSLAAVVSPARALDPTQPPSGNFDLTHWKLTLPVGEPGDPDEVLPTELTAGYENAPYFLTSPADGAMRFWAPVTGVTTGGSTYPRSELREQLTPGKNTPNWYGDGTHVLEGECRIVQVPSSGRVIIGQVHGKLAPGGDDANPLIKLAYDKKSSSVRIQVKHSPHRENRDESTDVVRGIKVGDRIKYQIKVVNGVAHVTVNGTTHVRDFYATDADWSETDLYFKAGAYALDNAGASDEGAQVDFYALTISHAPGEATSDGRTGDRESVLRRANLGKFPRVTTRAAKPPEGASSARPRSARAEPEPPSSCDDDRPSGRPAR
jgi:hypothetical protein